MKRRLLATFLSLCLLVGLLPTVALATDEEPGAEPAPVCTCESLCTEGAADKTCPVCAADYTVCSYTAPAEPVEEPTEEPTVELEDAVRAREAAEAVHDEGCPLYVAPEDQSSALIVSLPDPAVIVEDDPADVDSWKNCRTCSEDNPHMIYTTADLDKIRTHYDDEIGSITGYFKLANDIVFDNADFAEGGAFYNGGKGFEPIGVYGKPVDGSTVSDGFRGVFDGDDNIISGVKIYNDGSYGQMTGLFGWPRKSKGADSCIKNLVLKNFDVEYTGTNESSYAAVGAIAGFSWTNDSENPITIDNCAVYDSSVRSINYECTDGTTNAVGGIVGRLNASSAKNCTVAGVEVSGLLSVGGVCGVSAGGVVDNCVVDSSSTKPTTVTGDIVGGVVGNQGSSYFKVLNSYSNCVVRLSADHKKYQRIGGIAGNDNPQSGMELGNNAAVVDIDLTQLDTTQTYAVGGLIGRVNGSQSRSNNHDDVWNVKFRNVPQGATIGAVGTTSGLTTVDTYTNCAYICNQALDQFAGADSSLTVPDTLREIANEISVTYGSESNILSALPKSVTCTISGEKVVSIDSSNKLKALSVGNATVVLSMEKNQKNYNIATIPIEVSAKEVGVTMSGRTVAYDGNAQTITATVDSSSNLPSGLLVYSYKKSDADDSTYTTTPPTDAGTYTVKVTPSNPNYKLTGTLTATLEVTPIQIIYGAPDDAQNGRPYITYALNEGGTAPTLSELLKFYPVKPGSQAGTFVADTSKDKIDLKPGMGDDGDVYYVYKNDVSGNIIQTGTLPTHPTTNADGTPHSIQVELKLKKPNYRFCTVGTDWEPADTIILYVACYKEGMVEVDMYLEGDTAPLETFDDRHEYEYTGEGIVPTERNLTSLYTKDDSITQFTAHFHAVKEGTAFTGTHLYNQPNSQLTADALKAIAPKEPGVYSFVINGYNEATETYCYASRRYSIVKGTPKGAPTFTQASSGVELSSVKLSGEMKNAAGAAVAGSFVWEHDNQTVERGKSYTWIFTPDDTDHYNTVPGTAVVWPASSGGGSGSSNVNGSGDDVSISASGGSVTASQMESAVKKADEGAAITIKSTSSTTVTLPVGGMEKAADNDNDVRLDLRYGEITLSARAIAGMTDVISSNDKIKISITSQTSSKDETISDLLDKGAAVFDVSVTANDVEVHSFDGTLTITLTVSNLSKITDPHILHILTSGTKEYYAPDSISGNTITVKGIRNLSAFAVIPGSEVPQNNPFADVSTSDYYYDAVLWAVENGVTNGTSATTFGPNVTVSRAQMVTFLWRAHGSPKATGTNPFTDVSTSDYYYDAVLWAVANGVTNGTSATTFSPDMAVTRAQAVTFQWRAAGSPVVSGSSFGDVATDAYYVNAVTWAVANGITNGTGGNNFSPDVVVSRAQAVTFLYREQE